MKLIKKLFAISLLAALPLVVSAQAYPSKPVTLVNPYAAGGPTDLLGRILAKGLSRQLGQPVVVEYRTGGGASIAADHVAKSAPDGYTLLMGTSAAHVVTPAAISVPYDGIKDFEFIGIVANVPNLLTVHPSLNVKNLKEFIALAKSQPGKLSYVSSGLGSASHVSVERLKYRAGIDMLHIPYRGAGPAVTDIVAGTVPVGMLNISVVQSFVKAGRMRALAYASSKRATTLPDVPTFAEAGLPMISGSWYSLAVPAKTPAAVVERLSKALSAVLASAEFQATAAEQNAEVFQFSREETKKFVFDDAKAIEELIKSTGIQLKE